MTKRHIGGALQGSVRHLSPVGSIASCASLAGSVVGGFVNGTINWIWAGASFALALAFLGFYLVQRRIRRKLALTNEEWALVCRTKSQVAEQRGRSVRDHAAGLLASVNSSIGKFIDLNSSILHLHPVNGSSSLVSVGRNSALRLEQRTAAVPDVVELRTVRYGSEIAEDYFPSIQIYRERKEDGQRRPRWLFITDPEEIERLRRSPHFECRLNIQSAILVCIEDNDCPPKELNSTESEILGYYLYVCDRKLADDPNLGSTITSVANFLLRDNLRKLLQLNDDAELDRDIDQSKGRNIVDQAEEPELDERMTNLS